MGIAPESWSPSFRRLIRTSNKYLLNPLMLHLAGKRYWYASVIEHTGRQSGKQYSTPIVADRVGEDIIVPLPYGTRVDWVRNVLAAGGATVVRKGETFTTQSPSIIASHEALPLLPKHRRRSFERFGIGRFLRLRVSHPG
jgi:deazaflavin-dependent oxidoreductase (nitroreductase family)